MLFAGVPADFQCELTEAESKEYVPPGNAYRESRNMICVDTIRLTQLQGYLIITTNFIT